MNHPLRIAVADDEADMRDYLQQILPTLGHEVIVVAESGRQLVEQCRAVRPDLVITDIMMPDMDGITAALEMSHDVQVPVILVSAYHDKGLIERAGATHVMAYLIKPVAEADLATAIGLATRRFQQLEALRLEAASLRQALRDRKVVERAKGIVMKRTGLGEQESFRRLQKMSADANRKLVDIAQTVIMADEAFQPHSKR